MKNPTVQKTMKVATIAGASIIVVRSAMQLMGVYEFNNGVDFFLCKRGYHASCNYPCRCCCI